MKKIVYKIGRFFIRLILPICNFKIKNDDLADARNFLKNECNERELFSKNDIINLEIDKNVDLSVIIPVYNVEKYLRKCIDSVLEQTTNYKFEIILVDDGSTDSSSDILKEYKEIYNSIKIITQKNQGLAGARNTGINNAVGKYITFIDSDDCIKNGYIEKLMNKITENDLDIVMCSIDQFDIDNNRSLRVISSENKLYESGIGEGILNLKGFAWGKIYKKELWNDVRFPVGYLFEDSIIRSILLRKCKRFEYVDEALYIYSIRSESLSRQNKKKRNNEKYIEQFFLQEKIVKLSYEIGLKKDPVLYKIMLYELGVCIWLRTRFLNKDLKKKIFLLSCDLIEKNKEDCKYLEKEYKYLEKSFLEKNYLLWKLASLYIMLGVKIGNE